MDYESLVNYALLIEVCGAMDNDAKNMVLTWRADTNTFRPTAWDLDMSFGLQWDDSAAPIYMSPTMDAAPYRMLKTVDNSMRIVGTILQSDPARYAVPVAERYFELRKTLFSEEALLARADALYDLVTDSGARHRDATRWPDGENSSDNSFIQAFIPARLEKLDEAFALWLADREGKG